MNNHRPYLFGRCFVWSMLVIVAGCAHSSDGNSPASAADADNIDKCRMGDKILTCVEGICDPATGECVECLSDDDCMSPQRGVCWKGVCSACSVENCSQVCDGYSGKCLAALVLPCPSGNCSDDWPVDPQTLALANAIHALSIDVQDLRADERAPEIGSYKVEARVSGMFATVSTEFTIYNPNHRVFEGELEFPLPEDAVISGYAIDVGGVLVDGSVVEKAKARIAFENEVKKGVDPGLVEQIKGNAYRTRIYPIPADGSRQIRVVYTTPLTIAPNGDAALALPMPRTKLAQRDISISVANDMPAPVVGGLGDRRFESAESVWRVESHETDITSTENILVAMPHLPDVVTALETHDGDIFFSASVKTASVSTAGADLGPGAMPKKWRIIWDASGSRAPDDVASAREFINRLPESASYELHVFRNVLEPVQKLKSRAELETVLDKVAYDGGTDFDPLKAIAAQKFDGPTLFFTDGMDTMNSALPEFGANSVALLSGDARDVSAMRRICGGRTINLDIVNGEEAIKQIIAPSPVVSGMTGEDLRNIQGIGLPAVGRVTVVGRMGNFASEATVMLSDGRRIPVTFNTTHVPNSKIIATAWAARRVDELSPQAEDNREELLALGRRFSIVSPVSSMIVFERLSQWVEYDIEPPPSLPQIHAQWMDSRANESEKIAKQQKKEKLWLELLSNEWNRRISWWNHPIPPKPKIVKPSSRRRPHRGNLDDLDWSSFDADAAAASAAYGMGSTGTGGGGAGMGGFGAAGFGPGGGGGRGGAIAASRSSGRADLGSRSSSTPKVKSKRASSRRDAPSPVASRSSAEASPAPDVVQHADATVSVKAWDPSTPYLQAMKDAYTIEKTPESVYAEYLKQRRQYASSPAFFLDCAGLFFKAEQNALAVRILSNLSELKIDDVGMLRIYAWRLREAGEYDASIMILRKVAKLRADEALSWRDLALTLTMRGKQNHSAADIQEALTLFHKTVFTAWDRNDSIWTALIALEELNELVAWTKREKWGNEPPLIPQIDSKFAKNLDTDLRIMMTWDADETDIDMHVVEPSGEEVFYAHNRSRSGGMVSHDITRGYGPEEFLHKKAPKGEYVVSTKYFASHQQKLVGPATITVTFYTNWGRSTQKSQTMSLRLEKAKEKIEVGKYKVE